MLIEKTRYNFAKKNKGVSYYTCDMCKKQVTKQGRQLVYVSGLGEDTTRKKWDLCENCMKILVKNVNLWYSRIKEKSK